MASSDSSYASDVSDDGSATESNEKKLMYKCNYCPKSYANTQALGGHQNAHKTERWIAKIQTHTNQPDPYPYLYPDPFPNRYAVPPGFEKRCYNVDGLDNIDVGYNQCPISPSTDFTRLQIDQTQGMGLYWAYDRIPFEPVMTQFQPHPPETSPVCLDLCLGVGSSSKVQARPKEPKGLNNEDDHLSLKL